MLKQLLLAALITLPLVPVPETAGAQESLPASEKVQARLDKQETIDLMVKIGKLSRPQQDSRLELILTNQSGSKTPRSDFAFCMGLAYLGDYRAQRCVGSAFENGRGIVEDLYEAYTWYALALENAGQAGQQIQEDKERVNVKLHSSYPSPTEDDLEELVKAQKNRIAQYREETRKAKN